MLATHKTTIKSARKMSHNIVRFYRDKVTPEDVRAGEQWYNHAHTVAMGLAKKHGFSLAQVSGVISALSPACNWESNVADTDTVLRAFKAGIAAERVVVSTYGPNKFKAYAILTDDCMPETVTEYFRHDTKTKSFYHNILSPDCTSAVTVDRHGIGIALASTDTSHQSLCITQYRYRTLCFAYRLAAMDLTYGSASQLQAVTWLAYRRDVAEYYKARLLDNAPF